MKGFVVEEMSPNFNPTSNPGMDHEGQFYALLFPASWLGWQLLWPLGNPYSFKLSFALGNIITQAGSVASRPCPLWCLLFRHNRQCIPSGHPVLISSQVFMNGCCKIVGKCQGLPRDCQMSFFLFLTPFTGAEFSSPSSLSCLASG